MMNFCNTKDCNWNEKFDFSVQNSKEGVIIEVKPKDKTKVESLQKFAKAYKDFCGGDCC